MNAITQVKKWGHSLAVRIPSEIARELHFHDGAAAELSVVDGKLVVSSVETPPVYKVAELSAAITDENRHGEISTGHAKGGEFA